MPMLVSYRKTLNLLRPRQTGRHFVDIFKVILFYENWYILIQRALRYFCHGSNYQYASIGSGNDLAPKKRQVINWTNHGQVYIYTSCGLDELNHPWLFTEIELFCLLCLLCVFVSVPSVRLLCMVFIKSIAFDFIVLCLCQFSTRLCVHKDIVKHTVHTIVSWPYHKQWLVHVNQSAWIKPTIHDDVIKRKHFPRYWPFVRGNHRSPVNSPHKGQWREAMMFL